MDASDMLRQSSSLLFYLVQALALQLRASSRAHVFSYLSQTPGFLFPGHHPSLRMLPPCDPENSLALSLLTLPVTAVLGFIPEADSAPRGKEQSQ